MLTTAQAMSELQEKADRLREKLLERTGEQTECVITRCPKYPQHILHLEVRKRNGSLILDNHIWDFHLQPNGDAINKMFHLVELVLSSHILDGGEDRVGIMVPTITGQLMSLLVAAGISSQFSVHDDYDWQSKAAMAPFN